MSDRTSKIAITVGFVTFSFFFIFNYYLPSKIGEASPAKGHLKAKTTVEDVAAAPVPKMPERPSIAAELGVPKPLTMTYAMFTPTSKKVEKQKKGTKKLFEVPKGIETEVNFWRDIYTKYDKTKVVFHDKEDMGKIYSVIDISDIENNPRLADDEKIRRKRERVEAEFDRIASTLDQHAKDNLRSQTGIAEKFKEGVKVSGRYLGEMEKIFAQHNIPTEITRLPFVESMFNLNALSKVGASGIWQFMPGTGKLFMTINSTVDERNDPIMATHAAAKLLTKDHEALGSWPLAINAYNTGRVRIEHAVARLGTKDIARIIKEFDGSGYGFASRNFYPAFLAALDTFENREKYFGPIEMEPPLTFDVVQAPCPVIFPELAVKTDVPLEELSLLNFHLQEHVVSGALPIPRGFELRVPAGRGEDFLVAMNELGKTMKPAKPAKPAKKAKHPAPKKKHKPGKSK